MKEERQEGFPCSGPWGSRRSVVFGKELEIRRVLSVSHLKSSAFVVDYLDRDGECAPGNRR